MGVVEVVRVPCLLHSIFTHSSLIRETEREVSETELYLKKKKVQFVLMKNYLT